MYTSLLDTRDLMTGNPKWFISTTQSNLPTHLFTYNNIFSRAPFLPFSNSPPDAFIHLRLPHIDHTSNTITSLHILKCSVDLLQRLPMRDKLINLQFPVEIIVHQIRQLAAALDPAKGATLPLATGDELEGCWSNHNAVSTALFRNHNRTMIG